MQLIFDITATVLFLIFGIIWSKKTFGCDSKNNLYLFVNFRDYLNFGTLRIHNKTIK